MMVTHSGKGPYLQPTYFSKEMYLCFNLSPLHLIGLCQEIVTDQEYTLKLDQHKRFDKLISRNSATEAEGKGKTCHGTVEDKVILIEIFCF